jgi:hypothetical protein
MCVKELLWVDDLAARDLQLLPGYASPQFNQLITIKDTLGDRRGDNPHSPDDISFSGFPTNFGVSVDSKTGEVRVTDHAPTLAAAGLPKTMTLTCVAKNDVQITAKVRIRVHQGLKKIWLTPPSLTVRKSARGVRYGLLATFADDEYGDLSNWSPRKSGPLDANDRTFVRLVVSPEFEKDPSASIASASMSNWEAGLSNAQVPTATLQSPP